MVLRAAVIALLLAVPSAASGPAPLGIGENYYVRPDGVPTVKAVAGTRLTFRWLGRFNHTVTTRSGPSRFSSEPQNSGTYRTPRLKRGTYVIYCTIHGRADMSMKLVVRRG
ncbi:MAG: hypothetical protein ACJ762_16330 [Solirubrobacteraceae bacterium]